MATVTALVSVEEYLHSSFEYDAEYVDGRIVSRPMPQRSHSRMQGYVYEALIPTARPRGYRIWLEQRVRTVENPAHFRVPDLCLTLGDPGEDNFTKPPFLCIEILSPGDTYAELRDKVREYLAFGVAYVWIIDPVDSTGQLHTASGIERVEDGRFHAGEIEIQVPVLS